MEMVPPEISNRGVVNRDETALSFLFTPEDNCVSSL